MNIENWRRGCVARRKQQERELVRGIAKPAGPMMLDAGSLQEFIGTGAA